MQNKDDLGKMKDAINLSPSNIVLIRMYCESLFTSWILDQAEVECTSAIEKFPDDLGLRCILAQVYNQINEDDKALIILEYILKKDSSFAKAYLLYSKVFYKKWNTQTAITHYWKAIEKDVSLSDIKYEELLWMKKMATVNLENEEYYDDEFDEVENSIFENWKSDISFEDVWWMEEVKEEIKLKIIYPIKNVDLFKAYWKSIWWWILLYWPPGCGKTYIAKATAWEINAQFIHVSLSDVLDMYVWQSEKNLSYIFDKARQNSPCVIYFDEIDALAWKRSDIRWESRHVINQFLLELDWAQKSNEWILIIWSTNSPWYIDSAFRRPGRFEKIIFVSPPDAKARDIILWLKLKWKPVWEIDLSEIVKKTKWFSWADLWHLVDNAIDRKIQISLKTWEISGLCTQDLLDSLAITKKSTDEWFSNAKNYATYSNISWMYDDILKYLNLW